MTFGGDMGCTSVCNGTWEYATGNGVQQWYNVSPFQSPPPRTNSSMVWDPLLDGVLLFGGLGPSGPLNDTWLYNALTGWRELPSSLSPPARQLASFAYDPVDGEAILFGGEGAGGVALGDTWAYGAQGWVELHPASAPSPRFGAGLVYDQGAGRLYLFGGEGTGGFLSDTWWFRGGVWFPVPTAQSPSPRALALLVATGDGTPLLFGGEGATGWLNDTWVYLNGSWSPVAYVLGFGPPGLPGAGLMVNLALGPNYFILFGGYSADQLSAPLWNLVVPFGGLPNGTTPLSVSVSANVITGNAPLSVTFSASTFGGGPPFSYLWQFGDGTTAGGFPVVSHVYERAGSYTVNVTVVDVSGTPATASIHVDVLPAPPGPPFWMTFLGGPAVWALLAVVLAVVGWAAVGGALELQRSHGLRKAVGDPGRLRLSAAALREFRERPDLRRLVLELRHTWSFSYARPDRGATGTGSFAQWLGRRVLVILPQLLLGLTVLYVLTETVPSLSLPSGAPGPAQFLNGLGAFIVDLVSGRWGTVQLGSSGAMVPVSLLIRYYLPYSLELAFPALLITALISYPLGLLSGWNEGRNLDRVVRAFVAYAAFFPFFILGLYYTGALYSPFLGTFGDTFFGSLPSATWFDVHSGGIPSWVGYFTNTTPTGFPVIDAALNGAWAAEELIWMKILLQSTLIGLAYSALYLRYARLAAVGTKEDPTTVSSRARGTAERRLLWRETSRRVLPIFVFTLGNTFALFILIQSIVEWYFQDAGMGAYLIQSALSPEVPSGGPPLLAVLAFLVLVLILGVNLLADGISRKLDPRVGWSGRREH
jgi:ABC-type dipeptide/oligopeptide/nickel transport system permease component